MISSILPRFSPAAFRTESPANVPAERTLRNFLSGSVFLILFVTIWPPSSNSLCRRFTAIAVIVTVSSVRRSGDIIARIPEGDAFEMTPQKPDPDPKLPEPDPDPGEEEPDSMPNP